MICLSGWPLALYGVTAGFIGSITSRILNRIWPNA